MKPNINSVNGAVLDSATACDGVRSFIITFILSRFSYNDTILLTVV